MLNSLIDINDNCDDPSSASSSNSALFPSNLTRFHSRTPPSISVYSYLARLSRYSSLENAVLLSSVYYIDLLSTVYPSFSLNSLTVHRFLLTATTVGSKGLCDSFCTNEHYAKVGGIHANELDILEREFLLKVNYRILPREFNIEKCKEEFMLTERNGRKNSIDALEDSMRTLVQDETSDPSSPPAKLQHPAQSPNAGYDTLGTYYRRMVSLIGAEVSKDDPQLPQSMHYQISSRLNVQQDQQGDDPKPQLRHLIKTEPDTLVDSAYYRMIKQLMLSLQRPSLRAVNQVKNGQLTFTGDIGTTSGAPVPLSPLKRPNESKETGERVKRNNCTEPLGQH